MSRSNVLFAAFCLLVVGWYFTAARSGYSPFAAGGVAAASSTAAARAAARTTHMGSPHAVHRRPAHHPRPCRDGPRHLRDRLLAVGKATPADLRGEICRGNQAVAILAAGVAIGLALIISAAIRE